MWYLLALAEQFVDQSRLARVKEGESSCCRMYGRCLIGDALVARGVGVRVRRYAIRKPTKCGQVTAHRQNQLVSKFPAGQARDVGQVANLFVMCARGAQE